MQKLSKLFIFIFFFIFLFSNRYSLVPSFAQAPIPEIGLACTPEDTRPNEFHSLRPYQAATCGEAPTARFCSNKLVVFERFDLTYLCASRRHNQTENWPCDVDFHVEKHNINITLDESEFPIMGNTEDDIDDATKLNEYASWYLNGVIDKKENKEPTDEQVVNLSGPVRKLLPSMIQDVQRIKTVYSYLKDVKPKTPEKGDDAPVDDAKENHDQIVVDNERLSSWVGDLSDLRSATNTVGGIIDNLTNGGLTSFGLSGGWNKRTPPLPWDDGTVPDDPNNPDVLKVPFKSQLLYQKAYNEWLGKSCAILPIIGLQCLDNLLIPNKYAELWNFVPLSNNSDKRGVNYLLTGDGPNYVPSAGTKSENERHKDYKNAPLYFAHTQEVKDLSDILNKTYKPQELTVENSNSIATGYPKDVEVINKGKEVSPNGIEMPDPVGAPLSNSDPYAYLDCSAVNVRVNEGDNLFPGDRPNKRELFVEEVEYDITEVECKETYEYRCTSYGKGDKDGEKCKWVSNIKCEAEVGIEFKLGTKTPYANEIFKQTVAGSDSTFRKIFPKVGEGSPVECIADIPTTTGVTYALDPDQTQIPDRGELELKETKYPADGGGSGTELTFPHIGSVYEYFLKGIQTALRPKGYGEPIANGNCTPSNNIACGKLPEFPNPSGSCNLGDTSSRVGDIPQNLKDIISAAAETYKVQPNLIVGVLFGEGVFNRSDKNNNFSKFDWTEENVIAWGSCEPLPKCSGPSTSLVSFVSDSNWNKIAGKVAGDLKKLDPNKTTPDPCNLVDTIYAIAWNLHDSGDGGMDFKCFGLDLKSTIPNSCSWNDNQIISAIKIFENGYDRACFTKENSCATGGGNAARCGVGGGINVDTCEKISNRYASTPSHMGCVFDVSKGN